MELEVPEQSDLKHRWLRVADSGQRGGGRRADGRVAMPRPPLQRAPGPRITEPCERVNGAQARPGIVKRIDEGVGRAPAEVDEQGFHTLTSKKRGQQT